MLVSRLFSYSFLNIKSVYAISRLLGLVHRHQFSCSFVCSPLLSILKTINSILQEGLSWYLFISWYFCCRDRFRKVFLFFWGTPFILILSSLFTWCWPLPVFRNTSFIYFFFFQNFLVLFWFGTSIPSVVSFFHFLNNDTLLITNSIPISKL